MTDALAEFQKALTTAGPREISTGYQTVYLFGVADLDEGQLGYSRDPQGRDLTGDGEGDWRKSWLAIGYEEMCGDPIFVDLSSLGFPVYTAIHGGPWRPNLIAATFDGFVRAMTALEPYAAGRGSPVELEANPLSEADRRRLDADLACLGRDADKDFWTSWFDVGEG
jgi:hypothetical protein